jgi:hypothetical protein
MKLVLLHKYIIVFVLSLVSATAFSQTVVIDGEIRPRVEYRDGYSKPLLDANDPGVFTIQRTRLGMTFTSALLTTQITLQDARTYGQNANASADATTGIYEAWAEMLLAPGGSFKIGRQALNYDDKRLFSSPAWSNTGTAHDVALFKYNINDFQAHLGFAYNNNTLISSEAYYNPLSNYRYMGFLWLSKELAKGLTLTAIGVDEGVQDTVSVGLTYHKKVSMNHAYTFGGNLKFQSEASPVSALATAYFQAGNNFKENKMNGKMLALKVDYKISNAIAANIGTDYFSGDSNGTTDKTQSNFKKLYGADHTFNGIMDYWNTPLTQGLLDYYGGVTGKIGKNLSLEGAFHVFNTEFSGKNKKNIAFGKDLGSEFDFIMNYKLNTWTVLQAGWCKYFSNNNTLSAKDITTSATVVPTIRNPQWAYVMLTIKPTFLNTASAK